MRTILPLYALPLFFPYRVGTPAKGIGNHIDLGGGMSRGIRFTTQTKVTVGGSDGGKSRRLSPGRPSPPGHRQPEMRPQTSPREEKSTALRATQSLATATAGGTPNGKGSVGLKEFAAGARKRRIPSEKQTAVLAPGPGPINFVTASLTCL
jgi:hypothetical protein